jgi:hypothetical protein
VRFHYVPAKFQKEKNFAATNVATARRQANATALIQIAVVIKNTEEPSVMSFEVRPIAWPSPVLWWIAMTDYAPYPVLASLSAANVCSLLLCPSSFLSCPSFAKHWGLYERAK